MQTCRPLIPRSCETVSKKRLIAIPQPGGGLCRRDETGALNCEWSFQRGTGCLFLTAICSIISPDEL